MNAYTPKYVLGFFELLPEAGRLDVLRAMLGPLITINRWTLRRVPNIPPLYRSGVRYRSQSDGSDGIVDWHEDWQDLATCLNLKAANCKDLVAWRIAELQEQGEDAVAILKRFPDYPSKGKTTWHVLVERPDGTIEDPSRLLGMNGAA